jgi:hypothetical protein
MRKIQGWFQPVVSPVRYPDEVKLEYFPVDAKTRQRVGTGSYPKKGTQSWISITDVWPLTHDEITRIESFLRDQQPAGMTPLFLTIDLDDNSEDHTIEKGTLELLSFKVADDDHGGYVTEAGPRVLHFGTINDLSASFMKASIDPRKHSADLEQLRTGLPITLMVTSFQLSAFYS